MTFWKQKFHSVRYGQMEIFLPIPGNIPNIDMINKTSVQFKYSEFIPTALTCWRENCNYWCPTFQI